ncbi:MAG TPA: hypothetical protein VLW26_03090 [Steroidobacteraceae bacterium]|nr:hypothetical protein [Steroidobacteraceae bacterium]
MTRTQRLAWCTLLVTFATLVSGCVVEPREGYYDPARQRYYHEHSWHECTLRDDYCRE